MTQTPQPYRPVPAAVVEQIWQRMAEMEPDEASRMVYAMQAEQPDLLNYLFTTEEEQFSDSEREVILYIGVVLWQMMRANPQGLGRVGDPELEQAMAAADASLDMYQEDTEADLFSAIQTMLDTYPEPYALGYLLEALMEEHEDPGVEDENKGIAFMFLKVALDAMIARVQTGAA